MTMEAKVHRIIANMMQKTRDIPRNISMHPLDYDELLEWDGYGWEPKVTFNSCGLLFNVYKDLSTPRGEVRLWHTFKLLEKCPTCGHSLS